MAQGVAFLALSCPPRVELPCVDVPCVDMSCVAVLNELMHWPGRAIQAAGLTERIGAPCIQCWYMFGLEENVT